MSSCSLRAFLMGWFTQAKESCVRGRPVSRSVGEPQRAPPRRRARAAPRARTDRAKRALYYASVLSCALGAARRRVREAGSKPRRAVTGAARAILRAHLAPQAVVAAGHIASGRLGHGGARCAAGGTRARGVAQRAGWSVGPKAQAHAAAEQSASVSSGRATRAYTTPARAHVRASAGAHGGIAAHAVRGPPPPTRASHLRSAGAAA